MIASALDGLLHDARRRAESTNGPGRFRVLGLDAIQIRRWRVSTATEPRRSGSSLEPLPACVQSGWLVGPAGRWYGKLIPSSQLSRTVGDPVLGDCEGDELPPMRRKDRVLMIAMAASQSEPEWGGELGKLHWQRRHRLALREYRLRPSLQEHVADVRALLPEFPVDHLNLMSALWADFNHPPMVASDDCAVEEEVRDDFDVLLLVDPCRRWYNAAQSGTAPLNHGSFREDFASMTTGYGRVCVLGASMGGFAALSCADMVDAVLAFGPQINLESAPYRPGFELEALSQANEGLRHAVACRRGSVECHMSMDAHLFQATQLHPLPAASRAEVDSTYFERPQTIDDNMAHHLRLIVHPFKGAARVLEKAGLLLPLLAETLARLQCEVRVTCNNRESSTKGTRGSTSHNEWPSWQWPSGDDGENGRREDVTLLVGCWRNWVRSPSSEGWLPPALRVLRTTPLEMRSLAQHAPHPGDWFCRACGSRNAARQPRCVACGSAFLEQLELGIVTVPGGDGPAFQKGDWECTWCQRLEYHREAACGQCGRARDVATEAMGGVVCANGKCRTRPEVLAMEGPLLAHPSDGLAYCKGCCRVWERMLTNQADDADAGDSAADSGRDISRRSDQRLRQISTAASFLCVIDCTVLLALMGALPILGLASPERMGLLREWGHRAALYFVLPLGGTTAVSNFAMHRRPCVSVLAILGLLAIYIANAHGGLVGRLPHSLRHAVHHGAMHRTTNMLGCALLMGSNYLSRRLAHAAGACCHHKHHA